MPISRVNFVLGSGSGNNHGGVYASQPNVHTTHHIQVGYGTIKECWWTPMDNIDNVTRFHFIDVRPSGHPNHIDLEVQGSSQDALVRIQVWLEHD